MDFIYGRLVAAAAAVGVGSELEEEDVVRITPKSGAAATTQQGSFSVRKFGRIVKSYF